MNYLGISLLYFLNLEMHVQHDLSLIVIALTVSHLIAHFVIMQVFALKPAISFGLHT